MIGRFAAITIAVVSMASEPLAQERRTLAYGRQFVNDFLGDGNDRWRSGSLAFSMVRGTGWDNHLPEGFGNIVEYRFLGEIRAPDNLVEPAPGDGPWAGSLSFGMHSHFQRGGTEFSLGADIVVIGPQTQLDEFQVWAHDWLGMAPPSDATLAAQIPNRIAPTAVAEIGREFALGGNTTLRPFAEGRAGDESFVRVGFDLTLGRVGQGELLIREPVTGFRYRSIKNPVPGWSVVLGADMAKVFDSVYLPESRGYELTDSRNRARLGFHWQGKKNAFFYGVAWLGEEFESQRESQVTGAIRFDVKF